MIESFLDNEIMDKFMETLPCMLDLFILTDSDSGLLEEKMKSIQ